MNKEEYLFICLMEECAEVQKATTKLLRFGPSEIEPGKIDSNKKKLEDELSDLETIIAMLQEEKLLINNISPSSIKAAKVRKYMQYSEEYCKTIKEPS